MIKAAGTASAAPTSAQASRPRLELPKTEYELGTVEPGPNRDFAFDVRNAGDAPLEIDPHVGCGCLLASSDRVIAPGKTGSVKVTLRTIRFHGEVAKHIQLHTNDPDNPVVVLTIHGNFVEALSFIPSQEITLPVERGQVATQEVRIVCHEHKPLTIEKIEASAPFLRAQVTGAPTSPEEAMAVGWSIVTLRIEATAEVPDERFKETVTLGTNSQSFPHITLTVNGNPHALPVAPPRIRFGGADTGIRSDVVRSAAGYRPYPFRAQRTKAAHAEVADLIERIEDRKAIQSLRLSATQTEALLKVLKPAVEQLAAHDQESADRLVTVLPLLRAAANPLTGSSDLMLRAEAECHRLQQADRETHARVRDQLRGQVRGALIGIMTPVQRAAFLATGRPGSAQQSRPRQRVAQAQPTSRLDTFIAHILLTPAAVELLEADLTQAEARADLGRQARIDPLGSTR